jgi:hypothetical protein
MAELFDDFEINSSPRWPRLLRTLAGSVAVHLLLLSAVIYIPALHSVLRAAGIVSEFEFVDEDYDKTLIGQRATMINAGAYEKLYYPPGYFLTTDPNAEMVPDAVITQQASEVPMPTPVPRPRRAPRPRLTPAATPTPEASATPEVAGNDLDGEGGRASAGQDEQRKDEQQKAEDDVEKLAAEKGAKKFPEINSRPFKDLLTKGKEMKDKGDINLNGTLELTVMAERKPDGTLDDIRIEGAASDEKLNKLAENFIAAVSDSKVLVVLEGASRLTMKLKLDQENLSVRVVGELESPERARDMALGYGLLLAGARLKKSGTNEGEIWNSVKLDASGDEIILTFNMSRAAAGTLLAKQATAIQNANK